MFRSVQFLDNRGRARQGGYVRPSAGRPLAGDADDSMDTREEPGQPQSRRPAPDRMLYGGQVP
jgi:hypothetical protein